MPRLFSLLVALPAVTLPLLLAAPAARADEDEPRGHLSAAALVGYGFGSDYYGVGLGARVGYTLANRLYLGVTFVDQLGSSTRKNSIDVAYRIYYPGAEIGYELPVGPVVVRPYFGGGVLFETQETFGSPLTGNTGAVWPGATALFRLGLLEVGVDARFVVAFTSGFSAPELFATAGIRF